jgi:hypothetical protein
MNLIASLKFIAVLFGSVESYYALFLFLIMTKERLYKG